MPHCPSCYSHVTEEQRQCQACGEPLPRGPGNRRETKSSSVLDPNYGRCEWTNSQQRCEYVGTMSPSTNGGGPLYCRGHFNCADAVLGQRVIEESKGKWARWRMTTPVESAFKHYLATAPGARPTDIRLDPADLGPSVSKFILAHNASSVAKRRVEPPGVATVLEREPGSDDE